MRQIRLELHRVGELTRLEREGRADVLTQEGRALDGGHKALVHQLLVGDAGGVDRLGSLQIENLSTSNCNTKADWDA